MPTMKINESTPEIEVLNRVFLALELLKRNTKRAKQSQSNETMLGQSRVQQKADRKNETALVARVQKKAGRDNKETVDQS
jgi:hypothetical protein